MSSSLLLGRGQRSESGLLVRLGAATFDAWLFREAAWCDPVAVAGVQQDTCGQQEQGLNALKLSTGVTRLWRGWLMFYC